MYSGSTTTSDGNTSPRYFKEYYMVLHCKWILASHVGVKDWISVAGATDGGG